MKLKLLEIRDRGTFIAAFAFSVEQYWEPNSKSEARGYLLRRCGFQPNSSSIVLGYLTGGRPACADPYEWNDRTMTVAHRYIIERWCQLDDGDVVDVEYILNETTKPKKSEREEVRI